MDSLEDTIFAFQQGYVCGILGTDYLLEIDSNIDNADNKIFDILLEKYFYQTKLFHIFSFDQLNEFKHALKIGINNKIFSDLKRDAFVKCACRKYKDIIKTEKYNFISNLSTTNGHEIGKVFFGDREGIPSFIAIVRKSNCDRCGFKNYCQCFSFTDYNLMLGIRDYHYGTHVCVDCGKFSEKIYYKTHYKCLKCISEDDKKREDLCEYRQECIKKIIDKQVFYKNKNIKCLSCSEKDINPNQGVMVCSSKCFEKLIK